MLLSGVKLTKMSQCGSGSYTEVNGPPLITSGWASTAPPCGPGGSDNTMGQNPGSEIWICAREESWLCGFNNQMLSFLTIETYTSGIILNKIAGVADYVYV